MFSFLKYTKCIALIIIWYEITGDGIDKGLELILTTYFKVQLLTCQWYSFLYYTKYDIGKFDIKYS